MTDRTVGTEVAIGNDLARLIAGLADNKYFLGKRYAEWCTSAPTLESAVAAAAMAQDEIGHARSLYPLLSDLLGGTPEAEAETRTVFTNVPFLGEPFGSWTDFIAANFWFDTALSMLLEASRESSFAPLAQRARRMLEEEPLHWLHAEGWVRRLAGRSSRVREALLESFDAIRPDTLSWLDIVSDSLIGDGVVASRPDRLRDALLERLDPVLRDAGLPTL